LSDHPTALAFDSQGNLFETSAAGKINEFKAYMDGTLSTTPVFPFASQAAGIFGIAFQRNPPPTLNLLANGSQVVAYWQPGDLNFVLQTTTNLAEASWTTITNGTAVVGIVVSNALPEAFFRLQVPPVTVY